MTLVLWIELLIELALSGLLAWQLAHYTGVSWLIVVSLPVVVFLGIRIGLVLATVAMATQQAQRPRLPMLAWCKLVGLEALAFLRFCLLMLSEFRSGASTDVLPPAPKTLVVLLHGVYCNRGVWRPVLRSFQQQREYVIVAPNLTPASAGIDHQAREFARWLDELVGAQGRRRVILVGHSMGGLVARWCLTQGLCNTRIHKLICIATPHAGSALASWLPGAVARDLRPHSTLLAKLTTTASANTAALANLYSRHDNLVVPLSSAHWREATNLVFDGIGHMHMVYSRRVQAAVLREIRTP